MAMRLLQAEPASRPYRPLRDIFRPLPRPKTGFMVEATEVLPVVLTLTPGELPLAFRMGERMPRIWRHFNGQVVEVARICRAW